MGEEQRGQLGRITQIHGVRSDQHGRLRFARERVERRLKIARSTTRLRVRADRHDVARSAAIVEVDAQAVVKEKLRAGRGRQRITAASTCGSERKRWRGRPAEIRLIVRHRLNAPWHILERIRAIQGTLGIADKRRNSRFDFHHRVGKRVLFDDVDTRYLVLRHALSFSQWNAGRSLSAQGSHRCKITQARRDRTGKPRRSRNAGLKT